METFGLLKILTSLLENKTQPQSQPPAQEKSEAQTEEKIPSPAIAEERENAFLKLLENHEKRSKEIDKNFNAPKRKD